MCLYMYYYVQPEGSELSEYKTGKKGPVLLPRVHQILRRKPWHSHAAPVRGSGVAVAFTLAMELNGWLLYPIDGTPGATGDGDPLLSSRE